MQVQRNEVDARANPLLLQVLDDLIAPHPKTIDIDQKRVQVTRVNGLRRLRHRRDRRQISEGPVVLVPDLAPPFRVLRDSR